MTAPMRRMPVTATAGGRRKWISAKIAQLRDEGYPGQQAVAIAYHEATAVYLRAHKRIPADLLPDHPRTRLVSRAKVNPRSPLAKAKALYRGFREAAPDGAERWDLPADVTGVRMGVCVGIIYATTIRGRREKFIHEFRRDAAPVLAVGEDGTQLYLLGGKYRVTRRGIVDRRK